MRRWVSLLALAGVLSACESAPTEPTEVGQLVASIQGNVAASYEGSGQFSIGSNPRAPQRPAAFTLRSTGGGSRDNEGFYLHRLGGELPTPGQYTLGQAGGFTVAYERVHNGVRERYTAVTGELEITASTPERIEGTFRLTAVLNCTGTLSAMNCQVPAPVEGPRIEVTGSFIAVEGNDPRAGVLRM